MLKKILFQTHWFLGVTLGTLLAFSAITGGLMAFGPEITQYFLGAYQKVQVQPAGQLDAATLYARIREANPQRNITQLLIYAEPQRPAVVKFAAAPGSVGPLGPHPESRVVNPYTGELLPEQRMGTRVEWFMTWLREVHQGHWGAPGGFYKVIATLIGLATVLLFVMALSGLYLRWPRGIAARKWQTWFKINPRLKGKAFLWNLHSVLGTCVLLVYLVFAHSGAFQNGEMSWYGNSIRAMSGLPQASGPGGQGGAPGMGAGPGMGAAPGGMGGPLPGAGGPPGGGALRGPGMVRIFYMEEDSYMNAAAAVINARSAQLDPVTGIVTPQAAIAQPEGFGETLAASNQNLHEGRIFGKPGVLIMMLAALCMPVFYISGWMMYLDRRRRKRVVKDKA